MFSFVDGLVQQRAKILKTQSLIDREVEAEYLARDARKAPEFKRKFSDLEEDSEFRKIV